jgi:hypothetical protein
VWPIHRSEILSWTQKSTLFGVWNATKNHESPKISTNFKFWNNKDLTCFQISKHYFQSFGIIHVHRKFNCGYATHFFIYKKWFLERKVIVFNFVDCPHFSSYHVRDFFLSVVFWTRETIFHRPVLRMFGSFEGLNIFFWNNFHFDWLYWNSDIFFMNFGRTCKFRWLASI